MPKVAKNNSSRVTLSDVARRAGVSRATASLVLGGKGEQHRISADTLSRVQRAAAELDYSPNLLVRSMQRGRTHVLAFFNSYRTPRTADDLYLAPLLAAIERGAGERGYDLLTHCDFSRSPDAMYQFLNGGRADGLILFAPEAQDPLLAPLRRSSLPVVVLNTVDKEGELISVRDDVVSGMQQVSDALVRSGHRRIGAVVDPTTGRGDRNERLDLLRANLATHGVELPDQRVAWFRVGDPGDVVRLLQDPDRPTAVFCWRDRLAYYVLEICEELGIAVPDELSVVGYDGIVWPAATRHTAASVQVDLAALGDIAVCLLDQQIVGSLPAPRSLVLPVTLGRGTTLGAAPCLSPKSEEGLLAK